MSAVLNTNTASLWAAKNLLGAQNRLAASVERLSSGLRINRARDDAAGLGVANSLTAQINGANQGIRNLNDAISMVQTAEGAIAAASEMGQRILMLATQGANGTLGQAERAAIKSEMEQLISSINSISGRTKFSGNALLGVQYKAVEVTAFYSMQISNVADDKISLTSAAFRNLGGSNTQTAGADQTADTAGTGAFGGDGLLDTVLGDTDGDGNVGATKRAADGTEGTTTVDTDDLSLLDAVAKIDPVVAGANTAAVITSQFQVVQRAANSYVVELGRQRSLLGAYQNQMEYTLANITELSSNLSSARSRVIDTDYASETAALTRGQILQQAATAMLAQANQMPNVILTLLK
jgi:flagellin